MSEYLRVINNGDIIYYSTSFISLIIWLYLVYTFYNYRNFNLKYSKWLNISVIIFILYPVISCIKIIYDSQTKTKDGNLSYVSLPPGWEVCFDSDITELEKEKGILGTYNFKCANNQTIQIGLLLTAITERIYYINSALLVLVLFIYNSTHYKLFKHKTFSNWIIICLLLGTISMVSVIFDKYQLISLNIINMTIIMATMVGSSFGIVLAMLIYFIMNSKIK